MITFIYKLCLDLISNQCQQFLNFITYWVKLSKEFCSSFYYLSSDWKIKILADLNELFTKEI
jgi:hypothetical protein